MGELRPVVLLILGVVIGYGLARYQGGLPPKISVSASSAGAEESQKATVGERTTCPAVALNLPVMATVPTLLEQMSKLKIADLHKNCEEAELKFLNDKLATVGRNIYDLPPPEREQMIGEWTRRFSELMNSSSYWKANFSLEFGSDVVSIDLLMDLQANTDDRYKCVSWTIFYEINGKANPDSYFAQSACDGANFRKKGDHFYFDINLYSFAHISKHMTILMPSMPGGASAEYLGGEAEKWIPIPQFNWTRSSIIEFSQLQQRFQQKVESLGGG